MSGDLVLLTGASGHMGFRALVEALSAGYSVRAAVRSQNKADLILAAPSIKALSPGSKLQFVIVPDILADGAYDEAVKGVMYIVHCASPIAVPTDDYERDIIEPAIEGTVGILNSAAKAPSVKRVVITSSCLAVIPWEDFIAKESEHVFGPDETIPDISGPYGHHFEAYAASKVNALNATTRWVRAQKPHFDLINMLPSFFIGKNELVTEANGILNGTNGAAFGQILGKKMDSPNPGTTIHVNDVAKIHILSLNPKVKGNQNFIASSGGVEGRAWGDAIEIVKENFPAAVKDGRLPADGFQPTKKLRIDSSKTEKELGIKFQPYETQVKSVTEHYLELLEKDGGQVEVAASNF